MAAMQVFPRAAVSVYWAFSALILAAAASPSSHLRGTSKAPTAPTARRLALGACSMPPLDSAMVIFGDSTHWDYDGKLHTFGSHSGYSGLAVNGNAHMTNQNVTISVDGNSTVTGGVSGQVNWIGGLSTGPFMYVQSEWINWATTVQASSRVVIVDNTNGTQTICSDQEVPSNSQRKVFVARGSYQITICKESKFGDAIVAPNAKVDARNLMGHIDGFVVAKTFYHDDDSDQLHGGRVTGAAFQCSGTTAPPPPTLALPTPAPAATSSPTNTPPTPAPPNTQSPTKATMASDGDACYIKDCGCPSLVGGKSWCTEDNARMPDQWCGANAAQCSQCGGDWCPSASPAPTMLTSAAPTAVPTTRPTVMATSTPTDACYIKDCGCPSFVGGKSWCTQKNARMSEWCGTNAAQCSQCGGDWCPGPLTMPASETPTATPTAMPTVMPTVMPTSTPTPRPTPRPTPELTQAPTASPIPETSLVCTSSGDPHFSMFAGLKHHFQGIGEFVLAASKDGHFQVNTCQQRWAGAVQQRTVNTMVAIRVPGCTIVCIKGEKCTRVGECSVSVDVQTNSIVFPTGEMVSRGGLRSSAVSVKVPARSYANNLEGLCGAYSSPYIGDSFTSSSGNVTAGFSGGPSGNGYDSFVASFANTYKVNSSNSLFPPDHTCAPEFVTTTMTTATAAPLPFAGCENLRAQAESACMAAGANFQDCMDDVGATCELDNWVNEAVFANVACSSDGVERPTCTFDIKGTPDRYGDPKSFEWSGPCDTTFSTTHAASIHCESKHNLDALILKTSTGVDLGSLSCSNQDWSIEAVPRAQSR